LFRRFTLPGPKILGVRETLDDIAMNLEKPEEKDRVSPLLACMLSGLGMISNLKLELDLLPQIRMFSESEVGDCQVHDKRCVALVQLTYAF
jgi:hypothetical protein